MVGNYIWGLITEGRYGEKLHRGRVIYGEGLSTGGTYTRGELHMMIVGGIKHEVQPYKEGT